jgi:hypothetical protein
MKELGILGEEKNIKSNQVINFLINKILFNLISYSFFE